MPFKQRTLKVETHDGHNITLLEPLVYVTEAGETITIPAGAESDGASTPQVIWNQLPPFGTYWLATVLHDFLYRLSSKTQLECDDLLFEAMCSLGVSKFAREAIYAGVRVGGKGAFDQDRREQDAAAVFGGLHPEKP